MAEPHGDEPAPDVVICEIGGTIGDIESQPFLEAARQIPHAVGRNNTLNKPPQHKNKKLVEVRP